MRDSWSKLGSKGAEVDLQGLTHCCVDGFLPPEARLRILLHVNVFQFVLGDRETSSPKALGPRQQRESVRLSHDLQAPKLRKTAEQQMHADSNEQDVVERHLVALRWMLQQPASVPKSPCNRTSMR